MKKHLALISSILVLALNLACQHGSEKNNEPSLDSQSLKLIIENYSDALKHLEVYHADYFNVEENLAHLGDYPADSYFEQSKKIYQKALEQLKSVQYEKLSEQDRRAFLLFKEDMEVSLKSFDFPSQYLDVNQMENRLHSFMDSSDKNLTSFPFDTVKHYEDYLSRANEFPLYVDRQITVLRKGIDENITLSCQIAKKVRNTYKEAFEPNPLKNPFYRPILNIPETFSKEEKERLSLGFQNVIKGKLVPAYTKFDKFFEDEYMQHCRKEFGIGSFPKGQDWYRLAIRSSTNLNLEPQDLHKTGLQEVQRITKEIEQIKKKIGFHGGLREFLRSQKSNKANYFKTSEALFKAFEQTAAKVNEKIPSYFGLIPKSDFKIVETSNPEDASGSYRAPTESSPSGRFIVNTKNLKAVPVYEVTTLMLHETIPGHHFQLALQYEMKDKLSEYQRKMFSSTAFEEGWALYSEYLGNEMGMFEDLQQRFGNLNDEMLRAVRLVVDTGIHSMGWSQQKAIDYMTEHLASDSKDILNEVNRYSVWPGQALAYKTGQMKILELRKKAEAALGSKFAIKDFHKAVLENGTVSLSVLEMQIDAYIAQKLKN